MDRPGGVCPRLSPYTSSTADKEQINSLMQQRAKNVPYRAMRSELRRSDLAMRLKRHHIIKERSELFSNFLARSTIELIDSSQRQGAKTF